MEQKSEEVSHTQPQPAVKKRGAQKGRVMTEAQREGLKKGFEALRAKREAAKKEKEALTKSEPITEPLPNNNLPDANKPLDNPIKKTRVRKPAVTKDDLLSFKNDILNIMKPTLSKTEPISTPIVVEQMPIQHQLPPPVINKILTGSDLLNKIFFNK